MSGRCCSKKLYYEMAISAQTPHFRKSTPAASSSSIFSLSPAVKNILFLKRKQNVVELNQIPVRVFERGSHGDSAELCEQS